MAEHVHEWRTIARTGCIRCGKSKPEVSLEQQLQEARALLEEVIPLIRNAEFLLPSREDARQRWITHYAAFLKRES